MEHVRCIALDEGVHKRTECYFNPLRIYYFTLALPLDLPDMRRTYAVSKQSTSPVVLNSIEMEELNRKMKLDQFEVRRNFDKMDEDMQFFEKEKKLRIQNVMVGHHARRGIHSNQLNQSYQSAQSNYVDGNFLNGFKHQTKPQQHQEFINPVVMNDPALKEEMIKKGISEVYNKRPDKISALKSFMVL